MKLAAKAVSRHLGSCLGHRTATEASAQLNLSNGRALHFKHEAARRGTAHVQYITGIALAVVVCVFARAADFERDRSFYPTVLIVIASYYLLFATLTDHLGVLAAEFVAFLGFLVLAILGARKWPLLVAVGLLAHGLFDLVHGHLITNPGVPSWWPGFCLAFDVTAGAYLLSTKNRRR